MTPVVDPLAGRTDRCSRALAELATAEIELGNVVCALELHLDQELIGEALATVAAAVDRARLALAERRAA